MESKRSTKYPYSGRFNVQSNNKQLSTNMKVKLNKYLLDTTQNPLTKLIVKDRCQMKKKKTKMIN